jgi:peptidylprolyl isomerase
MTDSNWFDPEADGSISGTTLGGQSFMRVKELLSIAMSAIMFGLQICVVASTKMPAAELGPAKPMTRTDSGLQYLDVREGTGAVPLPGQRCFVHYTGWLWENDTKGKEFDSSRHRGEPFSFRVRRSEVILGWDEGVLSMKVGGKRELLVPAALAFGSRGAGGVIPPNATLLFEVELLGVMEKAASGLEFHDIRVGTGAAPKGGQTCVVNYTGWLWRSARAKKFDSSLDRDQPFSFPLGRGKCTGWDEGIAGMRVGGKRELLIPPGLAYGRDGLPPDIPPNASLFFEIELLDVK